MMVFEIEVIRYCCTFCQDQFEEHEDAKEHEKTCWNRPENRSVEANKK